MSMDPIRTGFPRTFQILWVLNNKAIVPIKRKVFRILPRGISHLRERELEGQLHVILTPLELSYCCLFRRV